MPFTHCIAAPGLVESESGRLNLSFEMPGKLKKVCVEEGQALKAGDLVAELENSDLTAQFNSAKADVKMAEAQLKILANDLDAEILRAQREVERLKAESSMMEVGPRREEIDRALAEVHVAEAESRLAGEDAARFASPQGVKSGAWSEAERDRSARLAEAAAARVEVARARHAALANGSRPEEKDRARAMLAGAETELKRMESTRPHRLTSAEAQLAQTKARLEMAEAQLAKTRLYAPIDGTVVLKFMHTGEAVDALRREPVAAIADLSRLRIRADVDEADFPKIAPGQTVKITAEAFDNKYFNGKVERVCNSAGQKRFATGEARERNDVKVVETLIKLDADCPFKLGLRVTTYFEMQ